ncbi:hypothetical protein [Intrasporangium sp.]|uniref:hypothetical protein n=1 Tax=Intrasporangium sp. TaxID=1925024 RepID=UPI0032218460
MGGTEHLPVGPGILGFIAVFVLAVALWFLMRNMNARMRRMAYRERDRLEQERQQQEGADGGAPGSTGTGTEPGEHDSGPGERD